MAAKYCKCGHSRLLHERGLGRCHYDYKPPTDENGDDQPEYGCSCEGFSDFAYREPTTPEEAFDAAARFNASGAANKFEAEDKEARSRAKEQRYREAYGGKPLPSDVCTGCGHTYGSHIGHNNSCAVVGCTCLGFNVPPVPIPSTSHCNCGHAHNDHYGKNTECQRKGCKCTKFIEHCANQKSDGPRSWWMEDITKHDTTPAWIHNRHMHVSKPIPTEGENGNPFIQVREYDPELEAKADKGLVSIYVDLMDFVENTPELHMPSGENFSSFIKGVLMHYAHRNSVVDPLAMCNHGKPFKDRWECPKCLIIKPPHEPQENSL